MIEKVYTENNFIKLVANRGPIESNTERLIGKKRIYQIYIWSNMGNRGDTALNVDVS